MVFWVERGVSGGLIGDEGLFWSLGFDLLFFCSSGKFFVYVGDIRVGVGFFVYKALEW